MSVGRLQTDNYLDFTSMKEEFENVGIKFTTYSAYEPQSNVLAERMNRFLLGEARLMIAQSELKEGL